MKVLTGAQMREVDRKTIESGIPGLVLMENAGHRVVEVLVDEFSPLSEKRFVIFCGKGNNGGDGMVVARQLFTRFRPRTLDVLLFASREKLSPDAAAQLRMLDACGCAVKNEITPEMRRADVVVDAVLGTGLHGPVTGSAVDLIREINHGFPDATIVAVDIPSGMASDSGSTEGEHVRADCTVTFTAPKIGQVLPPNCDSIGTLRVGQIGSPPSLYEDGPAFRISLVEPEWFARFFQPRPPGAHKGDFGHVLLVAGSRGKTGAAAMAGMAALRGGAGLATVATPASAMATIAGHAPELMTAELPETDAGTISERALDVLREILRDKDIVAIGPGLTTNTETVSVVRRLVSECEQPMVIDADALNALAGTDWKARGPRVLTPHPGEMARLCRSSVRDISKDRLGIAQSFAQQRGVTLVLKGQRTLLGFPDGRVWINPTGSPAMATGGTGDILTGLTAGLLGQFQDQADAAIAAAVWLHGRAGELGASCLGEQALLATDLLRFLPEAMRECAALRDGD